MHTHVFEAPSDSPRGTRKNPVIVKGFFGDKGKWERDIKAKNKYGLTTEDILEMPVTFEHLNLAPTVLKAMPKYQLDNLHMLE